MGARLKVAVTGAGGFLGRHVVEALAGRPVGLTVMARDPARLGLLPEGAQVLEGDIAAPTPGLIAALAAQDAVIHLAWEGLPNYRALRHFEVELPRQYAFLKALAEAGAPALVVAGTCFEYGMAEGCLCEERVPAPDNPYGFAKDTLRRQLGFLKREHPFALTWARLFYMYGPGQAPGALYSQLTAAVAEGRQSFDMSGGEQLRDFSPVEEVARRLVDLALLRRDAGIVNLCSGRPRSVRALVEGWLAERGWRMALNLGRYPYPDYEPFAFWGDTRKLLALLGEEEERPAPDR